MKWSEVPLYDKRKVLYAYDEGNEQFLTSFCNTCSMKLGTLKRYLRDFRKTKEARGINGDEFSFKETYEQKSNGEVYSERLIDIVEGLDKDSNALLEAHGLNPELFELKWYKNSKWQMPSEDPSAVGGKIICYQSKITAIPKKFKWDEETLEKLFSSFSEHDLNFNKPEQFADNGRALVVPIFDLHLGLYATLETCNNEYNIDIAERVVAKVIGQIKQRVQGQEFEKVILILGNDFLNADNMNNTTTRGTPQDNHGFWYDTMERAFVIAERIINELLEVSKVDVIHVPSNHDEHSTWMLMWNIKTLFKNNEDVTVDMSQLDRKYVQFGKTLIGVAHNMKLTDAVKLITVEQKDKWAECDNFIWLLGHLHRQMHYEAQGLVEVYRIPTISGTSLWSYRKGFVNPEKKTQVFVLDREYGLLDTMRIVVV